MNRKYELLLEGTWVPYQVENLIVDDVFRLFEEDGTPIEEGQMWIVTEVPESEYSSKGITCEPIIGVIQK